MNNKTKKISEKSIFSVKNLALSSMFAALITVTTAFLKIPIPFGYTHAGDSMVFLSATTLANPLGIIASAIGGALADLLAGYPQWAIPTAIIKALNAMPFFICRQALKKKNGDNKIICKGTLLMLIPSVAITFIGYFIANYLMYGIAAAIAEMSMLWIQSTVGVILFVLIGVSLDKIKFKEKI